IFVDTDQNPKTGFIINGIGAEILFENDTANAYAGSGADWNWTPGESPVSFENTGAVVLWKIPRSLLTAERFDVVFQLVDTHWNAVFATPKITYTVQ
ncbi:MAG: hypothetical protein WHV44_11245, partial [Anaerolineales bacterium]